MADEQVVETDQVNEQQAEEPYIPDMPWKTKEDAVKGVHELKSFADRQGNEVGNLRKQLEFAQTIINQLQPQQQQQAQQQQAQGPDYDAEINTIYQQMEELDPLADGYQKQIAALTKQSNALTAKAQHERTLQAATGEFQKALSERDKKAQYGKFYEKNPEFNNPEMQQRIREYLATDDTGLEDPLTAYRQIRMDDLAAQHELTAKENAELKKLVSLKNGTDSTGTVITKGQSVQSKTNQPKLSGAALKAEMLKAFESAG